MECRESSGEIFIKCFAHGFKSRLHSPGFGIGWIEKIPMLWGYVLTWILVVFMAVNILVSMAALVRYDMRANGRPAESGWEKVIDEHFDDERMDRIYPNAKPR